MVCVGMREGARPGGGLRITRIRVPQAELLEAAFSRRDTAVKQLVTAQHQLVSARCAAEWLPGTCRAPLAPPID